MKTTNRLSDSLAVTHPQLANEWCYAKNKAFHPEEIRATCCDGVWLDCPNGHPEYWMSIRNRAKGGLAAMSVDELKTIERRSVPF